MGEVTSKITDLHVTRTSGGERRGEGGASVTTPLKPGISLLQKCLWFVHLGNNITIEIWSASSGEK